MLLDDKNVVIYGADSSVGGAVARAFAREGARVFLAGRCIAELHALASELDAAGAGVDAAHVDALANVGAHADAVARRTRSIDACFNALGAERLGSVSLHTKAQVLPVLAVARHMRRQGSGVILTLRSTVTGGSTYAHDQGSTRVELDGDAHDLAAALTPYGVRVIPVPIEAISARGSGSSEARPPAATPLERVASFAATLAAEALPARQSQEAFVPLYRLHEPSDARQVDSSSPRQPSLEALLGPQRTAVMLQLDTPKTAGQIARALHTVPGGATHHLRELEAAGLVSRNRRGRHVIVERTERGSALLAIYDEAGVRHTAPASGPDGVRDDHHRRFVRASCASTPGSACG